MQLVRKKVQMGERSWKHIVYLLSDPCPQAGTESRMHCCNLLKAAGEQPSLTACGGEDPAEMRVYHNGSSWCIEASAIVSG